MNKNGGIMMQIRNKKGIIKYAAILIAIAAALYLLNRYNILKGFGASEIKEYVLSFGIWAPVIYIILFTLVPLTLFPDSVLAIAGGMCFGVMGGAICTMIGAIFGGTLAFFISRTLGKGFAKKLSNNEMQKISAKIEEKGFLIVLFLRLIPLFPFDVISYSAGLSRINLRDFIMATFIGTIPGILVFSNIGDKAMNPGSADFYISIGFLLLLLLASVIVKNKTNLFKTKKEVYSEY